MKSVFSPARSGWIHLCTGSSGLHCTAKNLTEQWAVGHLGSNSAELHGVSKSNPFPPLGWRCLAGGSAPSRGSVVRTGLLATCWQQSAAPGHMEPNGHIWAWLLQPSLESGGADVAPRTSQAAAAGTALPVTLHRVWVEFTSLCFPQHCSLPRRRLHDFVAFVLFKYSKRNC